MTNMNMRRRLLDPDSQKSALRAWDADIEPKVQVPVGPTYNRASFLKNNPNAGKPLVGAMPRDPFAAGSAPIPAVSQPTSWGRETRADTPAVPGVSPPPAALRIGANSFGDAAASFSSNAPSTPRSAQDIAAAENFGKTQGGPFSRNWNANGDAYAANNPNVFTRSGGPANYEGRQAQQGNQYQGTAPPPIPAAMQASIDNDQLKPSSGFGASLRNGGQMYVKMSNGGAPIMPARPLETGPKPNPLNPGAPQTPIPDWIRFSLRDGGMPAGLGGAMDRAGPVGRSMGEYWSESNAQFEAGKPSTLDRVARAVSPLTGLGSAVGAMRDAASKGSGVDMGVAAVQAIPSFAVTRGVKVKQVAGPMMAKEVANTGKTLGAASASTAGSVAADEMQAGKPGLRDGGQMYVKMSNGGMPAGSCRQCTPRCAGCSGKEMRMARGGPQSMPPGHGGEVPGTGEGDKIDAKYEPGEFVVSNDMLDAEPELAEYLRDLREEVLAKKGMTPEEADAKAITPKGLRAELGLDDWDRLTQQQIAKGQQVINDYKGMRDPTARGVVSDARAAIQQPAGEAARYTSANPPRPAPPTFSGPHGDGTYGANSHAPAAAESAKPAGRMAQGAKVLKVGAKALAPIALAAEIPTIANTETADYAKRFGIANKEPSFWGDMGIRSMGAVSDLANVGGVLDSFYADKRDAPAALRTTAGAETAAIAPSAVQTGAAAATGPAKLNDIRNVDNEAGTQEVFTRGGQGGSVAGWTTVSTPQAKAARALRDEAYTQKLADDAGAERARIARATQIYQDMGDADARNQLRDNASWNPRAARAYQNLMKTQSDLEGTRITADASVRGEEARASAARYGADRTANTARAAALRTQDNWEREFGLRSAESAQNMERGKQEDLDKMFSGLFMRKDDKGNPVEDAGKKALAKLEFNRATAGGNTGRKPAELQADAVDYVNLLGNARDRQNNSLWQKYGWGNADPSFGGLPTGDQMKGAKLTTVGVVEGAKGVNVEKGNYKLQLKDGTVMYFDREVVGAAQLALLKRQGAEISKD